MKRKSDHSSKNKVKLFHEKIVIIEEERFADINLTDGTTFLTDLIKFEKSIFNQNISFPRDTNQHMHEISIKMAGTHWLSIYYENNWMIHFFSKEIL